MLHKIFAKIICLCAISMLLSSCGMDNSVGGVTQFKTSSASATASTTRLEADLITGNTCTDPVTPGTIVTETVNFTINTTSSVSGTAKPLPIKITGWTVSYVPKNAGIPALDPLTAPASIIINPSGSATIAVPVTTDLQKVNLIIANPSLPCSLNIYQYDVLVTFDAVEVGMEGSKTITASLVMAMADRNN